MSTTPDEPRFERVARPAPPRQTNAEALRALSPVRGLVWLVVVVGLIVGIAWNAEVVWDVISEVVPLGLEVIEEALDTFFEFLGLGSMAQIATAYTGVVLGLGVLYFLFRKSLVWTRKAKQNIGDYKNLYADLGKTWWERQRQKTLEWWSNLDWMNRIAVIVGLILIGIPLALLLSFLLGSAVTMLFL